MVPGAASQGQDGRAGADDGVSSRGASLAHRGGEAEGGGRDRRQRLRQSRAVLSGRGLREVSPRPQGGRGEVPCGGRGGQGRYLRNNAV